MGMGNYGKLSAEFYDLDKPEPPPDAFDFYERHARAAGGPIHEPMCGNGRFLLPLLAQGLEVSGSDASPEMLAACRERAAQRGLSAPLSLARLEQLSITPPPQLVLIPSGSFGLLIEDAQVKAALARVFQLLAPGGSFLVEAERLAPTAPELSGVWGGRWVERSDGAKLIMSWLSQYSGAGNVTSSVRRYELVKDGQLLASEYEDFHVRSYALAEFQQLLASAGFERVEALKPYADAPADDEDEAFVFSCRKPAAWD